ncbi:hypothetical protein [Henriciella sp.]|uniref:YncE family protein n=1 Tax=Henriciella sp. TaxID=1968823 RepID=UPI00261AC99C|nr:hypothetical protein [Henriciella sp.]
MIIRILLAILLVAVLITGALAWREAGYGTGARDTSAAPEGETREVAIVSNAVGGTLTLIGTDSLEPIATLNGIPDGRKVGFLRDPIQRLAQGRAEAAGGLNYGQDTDLSRDGTVLYISRGFLGDVVAMDIASGDILWRTPIAGMRADHMDISPDGKRLYVAALLFGGDVVEVLDTETGEKTGEFKAGIWPHDIHITDDGEHVYVASLGDMQLPLAERAQAEDAYLITKADADTLETLATYSFEAGIRPFAVTEDEKTAYAQLSNQHSIVARDLETGTNSTRIDLPVDEGVTEDDWDFEAPHHGLAMTGDETLLCAAGRASDYAAIVRTDGLSLVTTVDTGNAPSWAAITGNDRYCFLPNTRSDNVSVIDLEAMSEAARIPTGRGAKHITIGEIPVSVIAALDASE